MIPLGTIKHKGTINFNTTYDREGQLESLHKGNRTQVELTPEEYFKIYAVVGEIFEVADIFYDPETGKVRPEEEW